jgi:hypothetical protein
MMEFLKCKQSKNEIPKSQRSPFSYPSFFLDRFSLFRLLATAMFPDPGRNGNVLRQAEIKRKRIHQLIVLSALMQKRDGSESSKNIWQTLSTDSVGCRRRLKNERMGQMWVLTWALFPFIRTAALSPARC